MSTAAVRNAAKGVDIAATGMYGDAKGYTVLHKNTLEAALKTIDFSPTAWPPSRRRTAQPGR